MTAPVDPIAVALLVTRTLETLQIPHTVGGSIASSIAGEPRSTIDIDVVAALAEPHIPRSSPRCRKSSMSTSRRCGGPCASAGRST